MNQEFAEKLSACRDRKSLIALINDIDIEKRQIKAVLSRWSSEDYDHGGLQGAERMRKIRRLKKKLSFLIEEREAVRQKLGRVKGDKKALNNAAHRKKGFCEAFVAAAERILSQEDFLELELKAAEILMQEKSCNGQ